MAQWQHVTYVTATDRVAAWMDGVAAAEREIEVDPVEKPGATRRRGVSGVLLHTRWIADPGEDALQNLRRFHELHPHYSLTSPGETWLGYRIRCDRPLGTGAPIESTGSDAVRPFSHSDDRLSVYMSAC